MEGQKTKRVMEGEALPNPSKNEYVTFCSLIFGPNRRYTP